MRKGVVPEYGQTSRDQSKVVFGLPNRHTSDEPRTVEMSTLPDQPCEEMSVDFPHVDGQILLLVIDDYSMSPFVEPVASEAASAVIPKLDNIIATFEHQMC